MIQIEYLTAALSVNVLEHKDFTEEQKKELMEILIACPTIHMSINPIRIMQDGKKVSACLNLFENKYLAFGGNPDDLKSIRDEYKKDVGKVLKNMRSLR